MEDVTLRALRILREARLIAAEDTRTAGILLRRHGITPQRLISYNDRNATRRTPSILHALDEYDVALMTDAGTPGISDPGFRLVEAAIGAGHRAVPLPGASALTAAVSASGLPSRRFHYLGFLPKAAGARRRAIAVAAACGDTLVVYESPHRLIATLRDLGEALGARRISVCRELTKLHEEIWRGTIEGAMAHFASPRGEFTLVIEGAPVAGAKDEGDGTGGDIESAIRAMRAEGLTARDAVSRLVREHGLSRRVAYQRWNEGR
jgi:16S rRNA (cytidine1402-2'-O)-methyltransferase